MNHFYRFCTLLLFVFSLAFLSGCSRGPVVNYVEGIVTLDGEPISGIDVSFVPAVEASDPNDLTAALWASGRTEADGTYKLSTTRGSAVDRGTTVGSYKVALVKKEINFSGGNPQTGSMGTPSIIYHIPAVFEDQETSGITVEVVKGRNIFNFALKKDGTFEITK